LSEVCSFISFFLSFFLSFYLSHDRLLLRIACPDCAVLLSD
jgi:hypothetical protein